MMIKAKTQKTYSLSANTQPYIPFISADAAIIADSLPETKSWKTYVLGTLGC